MVRWFIGAVAVVIVGCGHSGDTASLMQQRPEIDWLQLQGPLGVTTLEVVVLLDGAPTPAILDTGAMTTTVSLELAERLGLTALLDERGERLSIVDANGVVSDDAWLARLPSMAVGRTWVAQEGEHVAVTVMPMGRELVLIGYDILRHYDIVIRVEDGVVGLFPPGTAPTAGRSLPVRFDETGRALRISGSAPGKADTAVADFVVDTGADATVFPSRAAMLAEVPVDLRFVQTSISVNSMKHQPGRYGLRPLSVGEVDVGNVFAWEGTDDSGVGLLGNDVLGRFRTTIVSADASGGPAIWIDDIPRRGPKRVCTDDSPALLDDDDEPCATVRIKPVDGDTASQLGMDGLFQNLAQSTSGMEHSDYRAPLRTRLDACLEVVVRRAAAKHHVELVIGDEGGGLHGGVFSVIVNVNPARETRSCLPLPETTEQMGLRRSSTLHILSMRLDDPRAGRACPGGTCHLFTGPADLR